MPDFSSVNKTEDLGSRFGRECELLEESANARLPQFSEDSQLMIFAVQGLEEATELLSCYMVVDEKTLSSNDDHHIWCTPATSESLQRKR